jgi:hypothetical protein
MFFLSDGAQSPSGASPDRRLSRISPNFSSHCLSRSSRDLDEIHRQIADRMNSAMATTRRNDNSSQ